MAFVKMEATFNESSNDLEGSVVAWLEQQYAEKMIGKGVIPSVNGANVNGWDLLSRLRTESESKGLRLIVVKNVVCELHVFHVGELETIDLVRRGKKKVAYWFEDDGKGELISDRLSVKGFFMKGVLVGGNEDEKIRTCIVQCEGRFKELREKLLEADKVVVEGMEVMVSASGKKVQELFILVQDLKAVQEDLSRADASLKVIKDWRQLSPMVTNAGVPMFSDRTMACVLANAFFSMPTVPAFNLLVIGPKRNQKSTVIKFVTQSMMGGDVPVSGTASAGKGWLVSHKEDARPSRLFIEKNAMMIDEALKFVSGDDRKGLVVKMKEHFQKHMEILQRTEVSAESGNMTIKGRMKCSLVAVDNPDEIVVGALGKAYKMADAAFRRWSYLYMSRQVSADDLGWMSERMAHAEMEKRISETAGGCAAVRALMKLTRKKINECGNIMAEKSWMMKMRDFVLKEVNEGVPVEEYSVIQKLSDESIRKKVMGDLREHLDSDMRDSMQAAWLSSAAMRGWEVHDSMDTYDLVFDDAQCALAEMMVVELARGRIMILFPGIIEYYNSHGGVQRKGHHGGYE